MPKPSEESVWGELPEWVQRLNLRDDLPTLSREAQAVLFSIHEESDFTLTQLRPHNKHREPSDARDVAYVLLHAACGMNEEAIGRLFERSPNAVRTGRQHLCVKWLSGRENSLNQLFARVCEALNIAPDKVIAKEYRPAHETPGDDIPKGLPEDARAIIEAICVVGKTTLTRLRTRSRRWGSPKILPIAYALLYAETTLTDDDLGRLFDRRIGNVAAARTEFAFAYMARRSEISEQADIFDAICTSFGLSSHEVIAENV